MHNYILWECPHGGMTEFSIPNKNGQSICMECYGKSERFCDCLWDCVPLRGPYENCKECKGTGVINFKGTIVRF